MIVASKSGPVYYARAHLEVLRKRGFHLVYASAASPAAILYSDYCAHRIRRVVDAGQRIYDVAPRTKSRQAPG